MGLSEVLIVVGTAPLAAAMVLALVPIVPLMWIVLQIGRL